jgi:hypothetical protein
LISTLIEGSVFIISSFILGMFLYDHKISININAIIPILNIIKAFGLLVYKIFIFLLLNSFFNIIILYSISFTRTFHIYINEKLNYEKLLFYF